MDERSEQRIGRWRDYLSRHREISADDVDELEEHLREQIGRFEASGLTADEAFLIGVNRVGRVNDLAREYAREHSDRLWKQLVADDTRHRSGLLPALVLTVGAAIAVKLPALVGMDVTGVGGAAYLRNLALLVLPFLAVLFLVRRHAAAGVTIVVAAGFVVVGVLLNVYQFTPNGATELLATLHAGVALWLIVGVAYVGGEWRSPNARMDFIRFTGEWFVYFVLIALGGGVLTLLLLSAFGAIGLSPTLFVSDWLLPCGAAGAVIVAAWLVEAKQSVIENIAPVLTRIFTPLFTLLLLAFIVAASVHGSFVGDGRDLLLIFDVVLLVVVGLLLYSISARTPEAAPSWFEGLQLVMSVAALVVDVFVLVAMIGRIGEYGASANRFASLGVNFILVANLAGAGWHHVRFLRGRGGFAAVERWQTGFVPVYLVWSVIVVAVFPPVFAFA